MTSYLYSDPRTYSPSGGTAQGNYPLSNLLDRNILKPWRSTSGAQQVLELDLGADLVCRGLMATSINWVDADVRTKAAAGAYAAAGTLTRQTDPFGRGRAVLQLTATPIRYIELTIDAGSESYWQIGALYAFGSVEALSRAFQRDARLIWTRPGVQNEYRNGKKDRLGIGGRFWSFPAEFFAVRDDAEDPEAIVRASELGVIGIDWGLVSMPWASMPFEVLDDEIGLATLSSSIHAASFELREVV